MQGTTTLCLAKFVKPGHSTIAFRSSPPYEVGPLLLDHGAQSWSWWGKQPSDLEGSCMHRRANR